MAQLKPPIEKRAQIVFRFKRKTIHARFSIGGFK